MIDKVFGLLGVVLLCMVLFSDCAQAAEAQWENGIIDSEKEVISLRSILPTPVYSISEIPSIYYDYNTLNPRVKVDEKGHIRELEFIALKGSKFVYKRAFKFGRIKVYEVKTAEYPTQKPLYIDSNFVVRCFNDDPERDKTMPAKEKILSAMKGMVGKPYCWGGNYSQGIQEQLNFYPLGGIKNLERFLKENKSRWILEGVDCSGMLYQATNGAVPRNTSDLINYGQPVSIEGLSVEQIVKLVKPLDLIVWDGHVVIVFDSNSTIESRPRYADGHKGGVRILPLKKRLEDILKSRKPVDQYYPGADKEKRFVIRRFIE